MSYEQHCNEYALYGNPERDAMEYELAAEYDRWDGHRMDCGNFGESEADVSIEDAWTSVLWEEDQAEERLCRAWLDLVDNVPF